MHFLFQVSGLVLALLLVESQPKSYELNEAIKKDVIQVEFNGNEKSTHYLKPINAKLKNNAGKKVVIRIISGYRFVSNDTDVQDIISTQEQIFALNPYETKRFELSGMCIQPSNSAPNNTDIFTISSQITDQQKRLAAIIDSANWQDAQAQEAMWIITRGGMPIDLVTYGDNKEKELARIVAHLTNQPEPTEEEFKNSTTSQQHMKATLRGVFKFNFKQSVPIHIALFDERGIVLKEIYKENAAPGKHEVSYEFDALDYAGQTIHAKLIAFDDVIMDRRIDL